MITLINGSAKDHSGQYDLLFTDPPFEMSGHGFFQSIANIKYDHLLLIASMHQIIDFAKLTDMELSFDLVVSHISPKKSRNYAQPNYLHSNIVYFKKPGIKSAFDRRRIVRQDHYSDDGNHYYPSIFHAPKTDMQYKYQKNQAMIDDLIGAFDVSSVCDPFAGSGTTGLGCLEHGIDCTMIEIDRAAFEIIKRNFRMLGEVKIYE